MPIVCALMRLTTAVPPRKPLRPEMWTLSMSASAAVPEERTVSPLQRMAYWVVFKVRLSRTWLVAPWISWPGALFCPETKRPA